MSQLSDFATTQVIDWLLYYKKEFVRLNGDEKYQIEEVSDDQVVIRRNGVTYNLLQCTSYWYRRDGISKMQLHALPTGNTSSNILKRNLNKAINDEYAVVKSHIYHKIENKIGLSHCLGRFDLRSLNKLDVLQMASDCGLMVPKTVVLCSLANLKEYLKQSPCITKAASESIYVSDNDYYYVSYTTRLMLQNASKYPENFMASVFQTEIKKKYELRVFYLMGKVYPCVNFSQENESGAVDCRRAMQYRYLPYNLPSEITVSLQKLMSRLHLKTGSIDLIVDTNNNYIFLEINPVGQFVAYGEFCNYYLDKELAKCL